jgi:uncharacterized OB-fold protein
VCGSADVVPEAASGRGTVVTYTVNHQPWLPDMDVPYVLAIVELDEQPGLRLTTRLTGIDRSDVAIDMRVQVGFEPVEDIWLPVFAPLA